MKCPCPEVFCSDIPHSNHGYNYFIPKNLELPLVRILTKIVTVKTLDHGRLHFKIILSRASMVVVYCVRICD